jgi:hypothetical protein
MLVSCGVRDSYTGYTATCQKNSEGGYQWSGVYASTAPDCHIDFSLPYNGKTAWKQMTCADATALVFERLAKAGASNVSEVRCVHVSEMNDPVNQTNDCNRVLIWMTNNAKDKNNRFVKETPVFG